MTPIKNWPSRSTQYYNMLTPCNMSPTAKMQCIGTDGHQRSKTSGQRLLMPFGSRALCNLDPFSPLRQCDVPKSGALKFQIMGFMQPHCTLSVLLSLKGLRVGPNMKIGGADGRRSIDIPKWPWGTTTASPAVLTGGPGSRTNEGLRWQNREVRSQGESRRRQSVREWQWSHSVRRGTSQTLRGRSSTWPIRLPGIAETAYTPSALMG